ncbi:uncharacterized protein LOC112349595 [Selaginella moellendorffii]|uniref:uncharacterized protein LOC112349595 n=1 Tax=Selaginella moellendorffii TaxID=88036 RepID=UPI000D1C8DAF|nr:uncharacterized protein LOC112349595 [Selaginella moellendorffii]|eukprot:XP_024540042.1 uncharacterized protein LOC112349595 [Selaginella moellendorffii]
MVLYVGDSGAKSLRETVPPTFMDEANHQFINWNDSVSAKLVQPSLGREAKAWGGKSWGLRHSSRGEASLRICEPPPKLSEIPRLLDQDNSYYIAQGRKFKSACFCHKIYTLTALTDKKILNGSLLYLF